MKSDLLVDWGGNIGGGLLAEHQRLAEPAEAGAVERHQQAHPGKRIWSKNSQFSRVQAMSLALHVLVIAILVVPLWRELLRLR